MQLRIATLADLPALMPLMRGYYRDDGLAFDADRAQATMSRLLNEPQWGRVYLIEIDGTAIGYVAACLGFSLELGGNDAFVDEVFVLPAHRGRGYGRRALAEAADHIATLGVRALHLEVDRTNISAQRLYESLGYGKRDRYYVMTKQLEGAT